MIPSPGRMSLEEMNSPMCVFLNLDSTSRDKVTIPLPSLLRVNYVHNHPSQVILHRLRKVLLEKDDVNLVSATREEVNPTFRYTPSRPFHNQLTNLLGAEDDWLTTKGSQPKRSNASLQNPTEQSVHNQSSQTKKTLRH